MVPYSENAQNDVGNEKSGAADEHQIACWVDFYPDTRVIRTIHYKTVHKSIELVGFKCHTWFSDDGVWKNDVATDCEIKWQVAVWKSRGASSMEYASRGEKYHWNSNAWQIVDSSGFTWKTIHLTCRESVLYGRLHFLWIPQVGCAYLQILYHHAEYFDKERRWRRLRRNECAPGLPG